MIVVSFLSSEISGFQMLFVFVFSPASGIPVTDPSPLEMSPLIGSENKTSSEPAEVDSHWLIDAKRSF